VELYGADDREMKGVLMYLYRERRWLLYNRRLQRRAVWKTGETRGSRDLMCFATVILGSRAYEMFAGLRVCARLRAWSFVIRPKSAISPLCYQQYFLSERPMPGQHETTVMDSKDSCRPRKI
jgi:hypothetical protein